MRRINTGFTVVELVVVLVLIGILAAYAAPKFSGRGGYSELTVQQDLKQSIRFAQQLAMSRTDHSTTLTTTPSTINVQYNSAPLPNYPKNLPTDVTLDSHTLTFDRYGSAGNSTTFTVSGTQILRVTVEGATGYAH